jgi:hypothetical protein
MTSYAALGRRFGLGIALLLAATSAHAAPSYSVKQLGCEQDICLAARFSGRTLHLTPSVHGRQGANFSHFNIRGSCLGSQREVAPGRSIDIAAPTGRKDCKVMMQSCSRGGVGFRSVCGPWADWTVPTPSNEVRYVEKSDDGFRIRAVFDGVYATVRLEKWPASTHRNIRYPDPPQMKQTEGSSVKFRLTENERATVQVQACNRGGFMSRSSCSSWTTFHLSYRDAQ